MLAAACRTSETSRRSSGLGRGTRVCPSTPSLPPAPGTSLRMPIGVRRAVGATKRDILWQFMAESFMQCIVGGLAGITLGFLVALALRTYTPFPASVQTWVAVLGVFLSSGVGLFFGIYPALRASRVDPVVALRSD